MKVIEHRRHTMRTQPGEHLSQTGVALARRVGEGLGHFDLVVTSHLPRAFETAIAMGYAVDRQEEMLGEMRDDLPSAWWEAGFAGLAAVVRNAPTDPVARFALDLAGLHRAIASDLPDGGRALVVSHGGFVEAAVAGSVPDFDYGGWPGCDYCEGVRLHYDGGAFTRPERLSVEQSSRV